MIQRIQSVFLLLAALSMSLLFVFPIAWYFGLNHTIEFFIFRLKDHVPDNTPLVESTFLLPLIILTILIIALALLSLLMFRNMAKQLKLTRIGLFFVLVQIAALFFYYVENIAKRVGEDANYEFGIFLPVIGLLFFFLAIRSIQRDIKLIRSADRLR
jgi:uncharacterized membrane protein YidH (DUF202 family)